jgi:hypothetical protein
VSTVGAEYATVTTWPRSTAGESVRTTVDPLTVAFETVRVSPSTKTVNADVGAVVAFNASLYVSVSAVPVVPRTDELIVGAV